MLLKRVSKLPLEREKCLKKFNFWTLRTEHTSDLCRVVLA